MVENDKIIVSEAVRIDAVLREKRVRMIEEAIGFESGTIDSPKKHIISILSNGKEAYFKKPGKETLRVKPNIFDMSPNVGIGNSSDTNNWAFEKMWEYLIKISIINRITFKKILVILYRNCFLVDHEENQDGNYRYRPSKELLDYINHLEDFVLRDGFKDKFNSEEIGLQEFLYFVDLLGWNEDVKYHIVDSKPNFASGKSRVGRINTILSIISAPLLISNFISDVIDKTKNGGIIDVSLITDTIQKFSKSRGICVLTDKKLIDSLSPYLKDTTRL